MKLSELNLDPALVEDGVWKQFDSDGAAIKIAHQSKKAYQNKLGRMMTKAMSKSRSREMEQSERDDIVNKAMVGTIIMGIKGFQEDDGSEIEFTPENVLRMLNLSNTRIRDFVRAEASDEEDYKPKGSAEASDDFATPEAHLKSGTEVPA